MTHQKPTYIGGCGWWWVPGIWKKLTNCRAWRFGPTCGVDIFLGGNLGESGRGGRLEEGKEDSKEAEAQKVEEKSKILIEFLTSDIVRELNPERRSSALWEKLWSLVDLGGLGSLVGPWWILMDWDLGGTLVDWGRRRKLSQIWKLWSIQPASNGHAMPIISLRGRIWCWMMKSYIWSLDRIFILYSHEIFFVSLSPLLDGLEQSFPLKSRLIEALVKTCTISKH